MEKQYNFATLSLAILSSLLCVLVGVAIFENYLRTGAFYFDPVSYMKLSSDLYYRLSSSDSLADTTRAVIFLNSLQWLPTVALNKEILNTHYPTLPFIILSLATASAVVWLAADKQLTGILLTMFLVGVSPNVLTVYAGVGDVWLESSAIWFVFAIALLLSVRPKYESCEFWIILSGLIALLMLSRLTLFVLLSPFIVAVLLTFAALAATGKHSPSVQINSRWVHWLAPFTTMAVVSAYILIFNYADIAYKSAIAYDIGADADIIIRHLLVTTGFDFGEYIAFGGGTLALLLLSVYGHCKRRARIALAVNWLFVTAFVAHIIVGGYNYHSTRRVIAVAEILFLASAFLISRFEPSGTLRRIVVFLVLVASSVYTYDRMNEFFRDSSEMRQIFGNSRKLFDTISHAAQARGLEEISLQYDEAKVPWEIYKAYINSAAPKVSEPPFYMHGTYYPAKEPETELEDWVALWIGELADDVPKGLVTACDDEGIDIMLTYPAWTAPFETIEAIMKSSIDFVKTERWRQTPLKVTQFGANICLYDNADLVRESTSSDR